MERRPVLPVGAGCGTMERRPTRVFAAGQVCPSVPGPYRENRRSPALHIDCYPSIFR